MGVWGSSINRWVCRAVVLIEGCAGELSIIPFSEVLFRFDTHV